MAQLKKGELLKLKAKLAEHIRANWERTDSPKYDPPHSYYWNGHYEKDGIQVYIYFQRHISRNKRMTVNYVTIRTNEKSLSVKEIRYLCLREGIKHEGL